VYAARKLTRRVYCCSTRVTAHWVTPNAVFDSGGDQLYTAGVWNTLSIAPPTTTSLFVVGDYAVTLTVAGTGETRTVRFSVK